MTHPLRSSFLRRGWRMLRHCCNGVRGILPLHFRSIPLLYSTSTPATIEAAHFTVDYLVKSLGFTTEEAISTSTKVSRLKSHEKSNSVIKFFRQGGLDSTQIKRIICLFPKLLTTDVDKTLKPKIRVFQALGLSGSELVDVIVSNPSIITRGLYTHTLPSIDFLKSILGTDKNVISAIRRSNWLLSSNITKKMQPNVALLRKYGISNDRIQKFIVQNPRYLLHNPKWLEESLVRVEEILKIPRESAMFMYGVDVMASLRQKTLESKFEIFKSYGWSDEDVLTMARRLPHCLKLSEAKIKNGLNFFMNELGYESAYVASRPKLLMHSMEKRILPRNAVLRVLKEKKMIKNRVLYTVVSLNESRFFREFVLPCKDKLPRLYEAYINNKMDYI